MTRLELDRSAPVFYVEHSPSTNAQLKDMARQGAQEGTVLLADRQTQGRGRLGRSFASPEGGVYMSMLLRPDVSAQRIPELSACAALAARRAILRCCDVEAGIKWPNDLLLENKKVCGILSEAVISGAEIAVILGLGVNLNTPLSAFPGELRGIASSLSAITGKSYDRLEFVRCLTEELDNVYSRWKTGEKFAAEYRAACLSLERQVTVIREEARFEAYAFDILEDMSLMVRLSDGREENIRYGEASVRGLY